MSVIPILSIIIFLPTFGAILLFLVSGSGEQVKKNSYDLAIWTSLSELFLVLILFFQFDKNSSNFQFT